MTSPLRRLALPEFTALLAMLFATIAFSIDAMLPALPAIAQELSPDAPNRAQLIISAFVFGLGIGTFVTGPMADAWGRKRVIGGGLALYILGALLAHVAPSLELLLAARLIQGLGAAAPRIAGIALTRDLYEGREMARVMSFVMMVFMIVPAAAPLIGMTIAGFAGWRGIFLAFVLFGLIAASWLALRQPETLAVPARRALNLTTITAAVGEVLRAADVRIYTAAITLGFGQMMALLSSIQQIYDETYDRAAEFPYWFAVGAGLSAFSAFLNSRLVQHVGMRRIVVTAFGAQAIFSALAFVLFRAGILDHFAFFFLWSTSVFFIASLTFGNLNALAMQKMGHIAGTASSVISAISTVLAVAIAAPVGLAFDGTPAPAMAAAALCSAAAFLLLRRT